MQKNNKKMTCLAAILMAALAALLIFAIVDAAGTFAVLWRNR